MRYRPFGRSGLALSTVGLRLKSETFGRNHALMQKLIVSALENGINTYQFDSLDVPFLRAAAEAVEVESDSHGNYWPTKPGRKGKYAGKRSVKIDGISALVTGLTEARKHRFPAVKKQWQGRVNHITDDDE